jgi:hypothetical protein
MFNLTLTHLFHCFRLPNSWFDKETFSWLLFDRNIRPPFMILSQFAPLPVSCAEAFTRLLCQIFQKSIFTDVSASEQAGIRSALKIASKHVPFFLTEYLNIQSSTIATIPSFILEESHCRVLKRVHKSLRDIIVSGIFNLIDHCDRSDWDFILATVDPLQQDIMRSLYSDYSKFYKYHGKV